MTPMIAGFGAFTFVLLIALAANTGRKLILRERTTRRLVAAGARTTRPTFALPRQTIVALIVGAAVVVSVVEGLVLGLIVLAAALAIHHGVRSGLEQRQRAEYERNLPLCLDSMARSLRSGAGILPALTEAGAATPGKVGHDVSSVAREVGMGRSISESLEAWNQRKPLSSVQLCVGALTLALETGAAQAQVVDSISANLRRHLNAQAMAKSAAVEYQMSSVVLSVIPLVICVPTVLFNTDARQFMLHTTIGSVFFMAGLMLDAAGFLWMNQMIKRAMR